MNVPFEKIVRFGQQTMLEYPLFSVSWILGRFCNYKCSYCWPYANSSTPDHQSLEVYKNTINQIKTQARENNFTNFHWSFSGGEPTAYKNLLDLVKHLEDGITPYQSIHMTTNLSPSKKWWSKWSNATELIQRKSITASYHTEFANEKEFSEKCLHLMGENVYVTINQVMVPNQFYELYERCQRFADKGINVTLKPQSNESANAIVDGYTSEMIDIMQNGFPQQVNEQNIYQIRLYDSDNTTYDFDQAERFNAFGFNQFTNWSCNSGYQSVIIRGNEVKRGYSCSDFRLGTLDKGFNLFGNAMPCITERCVSSADSKIPKVKNGHRR
jgi:organic radical activating enzyme